MGQRYEATCKKCEKKFTFDFGGGFCFHLLRCDICGKAKGVNFQELGKIHQRHCKSLISDEEYYTEVEKNAGKCKCGGQFSYNIIRCDKCNKIKHWSKLEGLYSGHLEGFLSGKKFHQAIEKHVGNCECGGHFSIGNPIRCPKCKSDKIKIGKTLAFYD